MTPLFLDADLEDADWPKRTDDLLPFDEPQTVSVLAAAVFELSCDVCGEFACRSKACAPPPVGTGGSEKGGSAGGGRAATTFNPTELMRRIRDLNLSGVEPWAGTGEFRSASVPLVSGEQSEVWYKTNLVLNLIAKQIGIDGPPRTLSTEEFDRMLSDGWVEVHRGFKNGASVDAFMGDEYVSGVGIHGDGWYTTTDRQHSLEYTDSAFVGSTALRLAISPDAHIIDVGENEPGWRWATGDAIEDMRSLRAATRDEALRPPRPNKSDRWKIEAVVSDPGSSAALAGYDAIRYRRSDGSTHYVILNRSAVVVDGGTLP